MSVLLQPSPATHQTQWSRNCRQVCSCPLCSHLRALAPRGFLDGWTSERMKSHVASARLIMALTRCDLVDVRPALFSGLSTLPGPPSRVAVPGVGVGMGRALACLAGRPSPTSLSCRLDPGGGGQSRGLPFGARPGARRPRLPLSGDSSRGLCHPARPQVDPQKGLTWAVSSRVSFQRHQSSAQPDASRKPSPVGRAAAACRGMCWSPRN